MCVCVCVCVGADPEFMERGFICIKVWVLALLILSNLCYISLENKIIAFSSDIEISGSRWVIQANPLWIHHWCVCVCV